MKITESKEVYNCKLFRVTEDKAVDAKNGFEIKRSVVRHAGSAVMMAMDDRDRILLVRQYRLPADDYMWELPAGKVDDGEKPLRRRSASSPRRRGTRRRRGPSSCRSSRARGTSRSA